MDDDHGSGLLHVSVEDGLVLLSILTGRGARVKLAVEPGEAEQIGLCLVEMAKEAVGG